MDAIISDIEGNLEALQAVLADIANHGVDNIYCLGDIVGYGPNPRECIDLIEPCFVSLLGDHDLAAIGRHEISSNDGHRRNLSTRRQLATVGEDNHRRRGFLASLPYTYDANDSRYVHGSPRNDRFEYLFPEDIYNHKKMASFFDAFDQYCFLGHSHIPGIFTSDMEFYDPDAIDQLWELDGRKTICNVGSVGIPRDGDPRACYVLRDGNRLVFRRTGYDMEAFKRKLDEVDD